MVQSSSPTSFVLYHPHFASVKAQHCKASAEFRRKYFATVKFSTQVLISLWKTLVRAQLTSPSSTFLHALHNICATYFVLQAKKSRTNAGHRTCLFETKRYKEIVPSTAGKEISSSIVRLFRLSTLVLCLVPLRRSLEPNLKHLLCIRNVVPSSVSFPSLRDHLNQHAAQRRVGDVRNTVSVGLYI
jgi:hypothetical protein